jgi:hypothetical protein
MPSTLTGGAARITADRQAMAEIIGASRRGDKEAVATLSIVFGECKSEARL